MSSVVVEINGKPYPLHRQTIALADLDLIAWLEAHPLYPKIFWQEKETGLTRAAVGSIATFSDVPRVLSDIRLYGGTRFQGTAGLWEGFPSTQFWLPQIEITQSSTHTEAIVYESATPHLAHATQNPNSLAAPHPFLTRSDLPDYNGWQSRVDAALQAISSGLIDKVVLARKTTLQLPHTVSAWSLLRQLKPPSGARFAFHLTPKLCFLGATPERLFLKRGNALSTDAVAATCPRGKTSAQDAQLAEELLQSPKNQREFQVVKQFLEAALSPHSDLLAWEGEDRVLKGSHVQHIHNRLHATLKQATSDADLIEALHPTPALGGYPRDAALALLKEIEPFDRGWYGGLVGMISQESTHLYVAIRSALLQDKELHLFAGTGLVKGSTPEKEWEELEQKISPFMEQFILKS